MRIADVSPAGVVIACTLLIGPVSLARSQSADANRTAAVPPARVAWLLFADDLHLDFVSTGRLRDLLRTAASTLREDDSLIGLRSSGPSMASHAPSTNRTGFEAAIKRIAGNGLKASDVLASPLPGSTGELRYRAHTTLTALHTAIDSLAATPAQHKHLVFVSNGFAIVQPAAVPLSRIPNRELLVLQDEEIRAEIAAAAQAALDAGVTIAALDPRRYLPDDLENIPVDQALWRKFVDASHDNLRELAMATGGSLLDDNQPLTEVLLGLRARAPR
jgi:hypothetical protein